MTTVTCPGLPAEWVNAWLAAVGVTVLDSRVRLHWTTDGHPLAVLSATGADPVDLLVESWPGTAMLKDLPVAQEWRGGGDLRRQVSICRFVERARAARGHPYSWALSSTMTDLCVDKNGQVAHAPLDPPGPGPTKWLHHRLMKLHNSFVPTRARIRDSLAGQGERVKDNGLGFDLARLGSQADSASPWTDPIVEVMAFFGLAVLPVRGPGWDGRLDRRTQRNRQKGWREIPTDQGGRRAYRFHWPAWHQPLDSVGVDALMDLWNPDKKSAWQRIGIHAGWRSVPRETNNPSDPTRAFGSILL